MSYQPRLKREGTMIVTAKEGKKLLAGVPYEKTRQQTAAIGEKSKPRTPKGNTSTPVPRDNWCTPRDNTMVVTSANGEKSKPRGEVSRPRGEPRIPRYLTMVETAREGKQILDGEKLEKTRAQTGAQTGATQTPPKFKRATTNAQNGEESKPRGEVSKPYGEVSKPRGEESKPRGEVSRPRGEPRIPRYLTMVETAREGKQILDGEMLEKTRAQTGATQTPPKFKKATTNTQNGEESKPRGEVSKPRGEVSKPRGEESKPRGEVSRPRGEPRIPRYLTMVETAREGKQILDGEKLEKTRTQTYGQL